jgi:hypothetical protein
MTGHAVLAEGGILPLEGQSNILSSETADITRISALKEKINDEEYLHEAIQRIALILSNELSGPAEPMGLREGKKQ